MNKQTKTDIWLSCVTAFMVTMVIVGLLSGLAVRLARWAGEPVGFVQLVIPDAVRRP